MENMRVFAVLCVVFVTVSETAASNDTFPIGDPRACFKANTKLERFEVLPGGGWDNLRNENAGLVVVYNYSMCRTTEDGRFLIPDSVYTIPLKKSKVNTYAEFIGHWSNYTSTTAKSINIDAGLSFTSATISGRFSSGYVDVKSKQISDESYTTRVQLRYVRYKALLQPDTPLHPTAKNRLLDIAASLELNHTAQARYLGELFVRDFGTHVVTSVDAGAALVLEDEVSKEQINTGKFTKSQISAGASGSFFGIFHFGASYSSSSSQELVTKYEKCRTSSYIATLGGPPFKAENYSANNWTNEVDRNLVAMDRHGDPIFFLINPATLPNLPSSVLYQLYNIVEGAVRVYYEYNTYRGCTQQDSPNFSPIANLDDDTCKPPLTNLTFGGVYQTCSLSSGSNNGDLCQSNNVVNPKTGTYSCPQGYESVKLHEGHLATSRSDHSCHSCWLFFHCCHDDYYHSEATYTIYWCAATGPVPQESGYLFGGVFTDQVSNPVTQSKSCPVDFFPRRLGKDLSICISDDYELGAKYSVPFGGFMSCTTGNPMAMEKKEQSEKMLKSGLQSLQSFFEQTGNWPKRCPKGFSQHLAYMDQGCEINYCLKTGSLSNVGLPIIRRPPYQSAPLLVPAQENYVMFDPVKREWRKNTDAMQYIKSIGGEEQTFSGSGSGMSAGTAAGISIGATLACVAIATIVIMRIRRRRKSNESYRNIDDPFLSTQGNYGATQSETSNSNSGDVNVQVES